MKHEMPPDEMQPLFGVFAKETLLDTAFGGFPLLCNLMNYASRAYVFL